MTARANSRGLPTSDQPGQEYFDLRNVVTDVDETVEDEDRGQEVRLVLEKIYCCVGILLICHKFKYKFIRITLVYNFMGSKRTSSTTVNFVLV